MLVDSRLNGGRGSELAGLMCAPVPPSTWRLFPAVPLPVQQERLPIWREIPALVFPRSYQSFCSVPINLRWKLAMLSQMDYGNLRSIAFSRKCRDFVSSGGLLAIKVRFLTKLIFHAQPRCTF